MTSGIVMRYVMRDNEPGDRSGAVRQGTAERYYRYGKLVQSPGFGSAPQVDRGKLYSVWSPASQISAWMPS